MTATTAEVLTAAIALIELPGAWKQRGGNCRETFCAAEAIGKAAADLGGNAWDALEAMRKVIRARTIATWNDKEGRTVEEVLVAMRKAAEASA